MKYIIDKIKIESNPKKTGLARFNPSLFIFLLIFLYCFKSIGQVKIPETIVYGTVYNIFHDGYQTDEAYFKAVDRDMKSIREANFNLVMPFPFGQWDKDTKQQKWTRTDYLVDKIEQNQLMLMPIMLKSAHRAYLPTWKLLDIPDANREIPESNRKGEVKYMNKGVQEAIEFYFKSVSDRYGERKSLVGYDLWNECHYESIDEITIPKYRTWLKNKYTSLEQLNRVWAEDFTSWDQIFPQSGGGWESSMPGIDWELFRYSNNGDIADWCYQTMRKYDQKHYCAINTVGAVITNQNKDNWNVDGRQIAPHTDIFGISFYPDKYMDLNKKPMPYWEYSCTYDVTRCDAGAKPWYVVEAQTNQQSGLGLFQFMSYDDIHLLSWLAFADNCKGIIFWKWDPFYRGQQAFGRGLTEANGELAPRGKAAKDVGAVLKKYGNLLYTAQEKPAEVGILYDIVGMQKSIEASGRTDHKNTTDFFMDKSFKGTYKALFDSNLSVDILRADMPLSTEQLLKYKIIFMPYQLVIRKEIAAMLSSYVQKGGWLVADARTAIMDQYDFGFESGPGFGLDSLFATRRLDLYAADSLFTVNITDNQLLGKKISDGYSLQGIYYKEKLEALTGGKVVARFSKDQSPAIITHNYGKGVAVFSAFPLGGSYLNGIKNAGELISELALKAGVQPAAQSLSHNNNELMIKIHENANKEKLVYLINLSSAPFDGKIKIPDTKRNYKTVTEITEDKKLECLPNEHELIIEIQIAPHRSKVICLQ
jgi:beta-galactosidase GanA